MASLALLIQEGFGRKPHGGDLYVFRGRRGDLLKIIWHDGVGASLYTKRLERGKFIWPAAVDGVISISAGQLGFCLRLLTGVIRSIPSAPDLPDKSRKYPPFPGVFARRIRPFLL